MNAIWNIKWAVLVLTGWLLVAGGCDENQSEDILEMEIKSAAFGQDEAIPARFTNYGSRISPPFSFSLAPDETKSLAVVMDEPEYITGTCTHWLVWGLAAKSFLPENAIKYPPEGAVFGTPDGKETASYSPPSPPAGKTHEFVFQVYALDKKINLKSGANRAALDAAMAEYILAKGELVGLVTGR